MTIESSRSRNQRHDDSEAVPFYPVLNPREINTSLTDYRDTLPLAVQEQLTDEDRVIHVVTPETKTPQAAPSALREVVRLCGVTKSRDIGKNGGPVASLSSHENADVAALRKFEVLHGRDALRISLDLHNRFPNLLAATLHTLAETQGREQEPVVPNTPHRQEEPGRIILLDRSPDDPVGKKFSKELGWGWPFYGSIDATPTFISAMVKHTLKHDGQFLENTYTARDGETHTLRDALELSTNWLTTKLQENPEGLLEFKNPVASGGMSAQAWKDSAFAYVHADGSRANHKKGIASVEVQALAYDALLDMAALHHQEGDTYRAADLETQARYLRKQIIDIFWTQPTAPNHGDGFFALATDRDNNDQLRTLKVRSSNMGHLLNSRLIEGNDAATVAMREATIRHLFSPEMLHATGIRTLASDEKAFRAGGYHTGAVWPWDTAHIANGLARHNAPHLAWNLRERIWNTSQQTKKFLEFSQGTTDNTVHTSNSEIYVWNNEHQVLHLFEQPPQEIQGWTASAILAAKYAYSDYLKQKESTPITSFEQLIMAQLPAIER